MKSVKYTFRIMEFAMLLGVIAFTFCTDWQEVEEIGAAWMFKVMIVGCALNAVVMQSEYQSIDLDDDDTE